MTFYAVPGSIFFIHKLGFEGLGSAFYRFGGLSVMKNNDTKRGLF